MGGDPTRGVWVPHRRQWSDLLRRHIGRWSMRKTEIGLVATIRRLGGLKLRAMGLIPNTVVLSRPKYRTPGSLGAAHR